MKPFRTTPALFVLGIVSVAVRLSFLGLWSNRYPWGDGLFYAVITDQAYRFGTLHDYLWLFPPGFSFSALIFRPWVSTETALTLVSLLSSALLPLVVFAVARRLIPEREAYFAGVWTALSPLLVGLSGEFLADSQFILFCWLLILVTLRLTVVPSPKIGGGLGRGLKEDSQKHSSYQSKNLLNWLLFAMLWAGAYLIKPEGFFLGLILFFLGIVFTYRRGGTPRTVAGPALALLVATLLALPYPYWLKLQTGRWMLSGKAPLNLMHAEAKRQTSNHLDELHLVYNQAFALTEDGQFAFLTGGPSVFDTIVRHPAESLRVYAKNWLNSVKLLHLRTLILFAAIALGLWESIWRWRVRRSKLSWFIPAVSIVLLILPPLFVSMAQPSFHPDRMFAPTLPLFLILASMGVNSLSRRGLLNHFLSRQQTRLTLFAILGLITVPMVVTNALQVNQRTKAGKETIARRTYILQKWMDRNLAPDAVIASTSLLDDLYLGHPTVWLPNERRIDRLEPYLTSRRVDVVISDPGGGVYASGFNGLEVKAYEPVNDTSLPQGLRIFRRKLDINSHS